MKAIVVLCCLALAGCVEVSRFKGADGDLYYADCDNPIRLQSCRSALEATCPGGYDFMRTNLRNEGDHQVFTNSGYFRCR